MTVHFKVRVGLLFGMKNWMRSSRRREVALQAAVDVPLVRRVDAATFMRGFLDWRASCGLPTTQGTNTLPNLSATVSSGRRQEVGQVGDALLRGAVVGRAEQLLGWMSPLSMSPPRHTTAPGYSLVARPM